MREGVCVCVWGGGGGGAAAGYLERIGRRWRGLSGINGGKAEGEGYDQERDGGLELGLKSKTGVQRKGGRSVLNEGVIEGWKKEMKE